MTPPRRGPVRAAPARGLARRALAAVLCAGILVSSVSTVAAVTTADTQNSAPTVDLTLLAALDRLEVTGKWFFISGLDARAAVIEASSAAYDEARTALVAASIRDAALEAGIDQHQQALEVALVQQAGLWRDHGSAVELLDVRRDDRAALVATRKAAGDELAAVLDARTQLAVEAYVGGRQRSVAEALMPEAGGAVPASRIGIELGQAASEELQWLDDSWRAWIGELDDDLVALDRQILGLEERRDDLATAITAVEAVVATERDTLSALRAARRALTRAIPDLVEDAATLHRRSWIGDTSMTPVVLDAYLGAAEWAGEERPGCDLDWTVLAGIGLIESNHAVGTRGPVHDDGRTVARILGVVLDGETPDTQVVVDTDGGALDGNPEFDRAVGPMQFLPGTWRGFARDGNGDGVIDPHNVYDATVAAAAYLCEGHHLGSAVGLRGALLSYNNADRYVRAVTTAMDEYVLMNLPAGDVAHVLLTGGADPNSS
ncbi:MAG: lytic transglycosylase domain-containing protein [Acidimicrobiales bacterium]